MHDYKDYLDIQLRLIKDILTDNPSTTYLKINEFAVNLLRNIENFNKLTIDQQAQISADYRQKLLESEAIFYLY